MNKLIAAGAAGVLAFLAFSCDKNPLGPTDSGKSVPYVLSVALSPSSVILPANGPTTVSTTLNATVIDRGGANDVREISYAVYAPGATDVTFTGTIGPGTVVDDSTLSFSGNIAIDAGTLGVGEFAIEASVSSAAGLMSNAQRRSLTVIRQGNHPPHILQLTAPDTVRRPGGTDINTYTFAVAVQDSDGLGDIQSVYFRNFTSANPQDFTMYDDGNTLAHGDLLAGDGIYSLIVSVNSTNTPGPKEFHFFVVDKSGARDEKIKTIIVD